METCTFIAIILSCVVTCTSGRELSPPTSTRIRWGEVRNTGFMVRWRDMTGQCMSYNVFVYAGYTTKVMRTYENVSNTNLYIDNLKKQTVYGVRCQCVDETGRVSALGRPGRTRTFGRTTTTTTPAPTAPTPIGACGIGYFTCETDQSECIDESFWCDKSKDCSDGTDERNCPGHCDEITEFHKSGNYTCSRWNSRRSACFFQCNGDFVRYGPWYTMCVHDEWTRAIPTCRLRRPDVTIVNDGLTRAAIGVRFAGMDQAANYVVISVVDTDTNTPVVVQFAYEELDGSVEGVIVGLEGGKTYSVVIAGVDDDGVTGMSSRPRTGRTAPAGDLGKDERSGNPIDIQ